MTFSRLKLHLDYFFIEQFSHLHITSMQITLKMHISTSDIHLLKRCCFIFRGRRREGGREGQKHQHVVSSHAPPTGDWPAT